MKDLSYLSFERLLEEEEERGRGDDYSLEPEPVETPAHWMTEEEIQRYKELIAESHHLAVAQILQERGPWIDKDGEPNMMAVFPHDDTPYKRCIHGGKFGCDECQKMRYPNDNPEWLSRLDGVPEPPNTEE